MKHSFKPMLMAATMLALMLTFNSCDDILGEWSRPTPNPVTPSGGGGTATVTSISIDPTLALKVGETGQLTAKVDPAGTAVTWSSDQEAVATVDASGLVTAVAAGTAVITATANDGSGVKATCTVTVKIPGLLAGKFSVSATKKVQFSQGNLQAKIASYASNVATASEWRFADSQYSYIGNAAGNTSFAVDTWVDLFSWVGESANNDTYGLITFTSSTQVNHGNNTSESLKSDWGKLAISNGGNAANSGWRTLTSAEWTYLFQTRTDAANKFGYATVAGKNGIIIVPDEFTDPMKNGGSNAFVGSTTTGFNANVYTEDNWTAMEAAGCVFLPAAGNRFGTEVFEAGSKGRYRSSTVYDAYGAYSVAFISSDLNPPGDFNRHNGHSVRLVRDVAE